MVCFYEMEFLISDFIWFLFFSFIYIFKEPVFGFIDFFGFSIVSFVSISYLIFIIFFLLLIFGFVFF